MCQKGGKFGIGPGHGSVKCQLPDVPADFAFFVAGEELGVIFCRVVVAMFGFLVLRRFSHAAQTHDFFDELCMPGSVF